MVISRQFASFGWLAQAQGIDLPYMFFLRLLKKIILLNPAKNSTGDVLFVKEYEC